MLGQTRNRDAITPEITVRKAPDDNGYDLLVSARNDDAQPRPLGPVTIAGLALGRRVDLRDMRWGGRSRPADALTPQPEVLAYPGDLYSPVAVLSGEKHTVGVSVIYPVLEYRHDVAFHPTSPDWMNRDREPDDRLWALFIHFSRPDAGSSILEYDAVLQPGESREYTIAVRVTRNPDDWLRTITPYAEHFARSFGPVAYTRDPRPVRGVTYAVGASQSPTNPDGWRGDYGVNTLGWGRVVREIVSEIPYQRVMIWAPSGLYRTGDNYPFQFTSRWLDHPLVATATDPVSGLPRVRAAGKSLGLWWGNAARYASTWDPADQPTLDPDNPVHRAAAMRELDLAREAHADMIGLDAMSHKRIAMWDQLAWLDALRDRAPGATFILEPRTCDFLHNDAPMYFRGYGVAPVVRTPADLTNIRSPHYLADLLNPGHETWASLRWDPNVRQGMRTTEIERIADCRRAAALGFVPLMFSVVPHQPEFNASRSWLSTIPADLREHLDTLRAQARTP